MSFRTIISVLPSQVKAEAIKKTFASPVNPTIPATILKTHPDWTLILDTESASLIYAS